MDNFLDKFIEALKIFRMYTKTPYPCWCNIEEFHVGVDPETIPDGDKERLEELVIPRMSNVCMIAMEKPVKILLMLITLRK